MNLYVLISIFSYLEWIFKCLLPTHCAIHMVISLIVQTYENNNQIGVHCCASRIGLGKEIIDPIREKICPQDHQSGAQLIAYIELCSTGFHCNFCTKLLSIFQVSVLLPWPIESLQTHLLPRESAFVIRIQLWYFNCATRMNQHLIEVDTDVLLYPKWGLTLTTIAWTISLASNPKHAITECLWKLEKRSSIWSSFW